MLENVVDRQLFSAYYRLLYQYFAYDRITHNRLIAASRLCSDYRTKLLPKIISQLRAVGRLRHIEVDAAWFADSIEKMR